MAQVELHPDATMTWRSPSGRTNHTHPCHYHDPPPNEPDIEEPKPTTPSGPRTRRLNLRRRGNRLRQGEDDRYHGGTTTEPRDAGGSASRFVGLGGWQRRIRLRRSRRW